MDCERSIDRWAVVPHPDGARSVHARVPAYPCGSLADGRESRGALERMIRVRSAPESITSDGASEFGGKTSYVRRTKREHLRSLIEILESTASPDRRVLDRVRAPNLNLSAVSFSGRSERQPVTFFALLTQGFTATDTSCWDDLSK